VKQHKNRGRRGGKAHAEKGVMLIDSCPDNGFTPVVATLTVRDVEKFYKFVLKELASRGGPV